MLYEVITPALLLFPVLGSHLDKRFVLMALVDQVLLTDRQDVEHKIVQVQARSYNFV